MTKTFINGEGSTKFNAATIGMLYTYWHEIAKDDITHPTIDEQKEIEELLSLLPSDLVLTQISVQSLVTNEFAYTYVFKRPIKFLAFLYVLGAKPSFHTWEGR